MALIGSQGKVFVNIIAGPSKCNKHTLKLLKSEHKLNATIISKQTRVVVSAFDSINDLHKHVYTEALCTCQAK